MTADADLTEAVALVVERVLSDVGMHDGATTVADLTVARKSSTADLVSSLDLAVERGLRAALPALVPGSNVLGEEYGGDVSGHTWVVDPIDGTTNFVHGVPYSACSVALLEDGRPRVAVVRNLSEGSTYFASRGGGAFRQHGTDRTPLRVSPTAHLSGALLGFGVPYDRAQGPRLFRVAQRLYERAQDVRRMGSAALDLVGVAQGHLDAFFELDLRIWDVAGPALILGEAGGHVTDWSGQPLSWSSPDQRMTVVASNSLLHEEMVDAITVALRSYP